MLEIFWRLVWGASRRGIVGGLHRDRYARSMLTFGVEEEGKVGDVGLGASIMAVARSGLITSLVTDRAAAERLLSLPRVEHAQLARTRMQRV